MTRVIIETGDGHRATVEVKKDDLKADELLLLVFEAMLAKGYTRESIEKHLNVEALLAT